MDHKLFLEKLSEVCEWEYRQHQGQTNHNWRADTDDIEPPQYIYVKKLKTPDCDPAQGFHKNTVIKEYGWMRKRFLVERCPDCAMARTRHSEWFKIDSISGIAGQAYYKEFGGDRKHNQKLNVVKENGVVRIQNGYEVQEDENSVISRWVDK